MEHIDTTWMADSACGPDDAHLFFPIANPRAAHAAVSICISECPVRAACLTYALDTGTTEGIWGGLSETDRAPLHAATRLTRDHVAHRVQRAQLLKESGLSLAKIAQELGVCDRTIHRDLKTV